MEVEFQPSPTFADTFVSGSSQLLVLLNICVLVLNLSLENLPQPPLVNKMASFSVFKKGKLQIALPYQLSLTQSGLIYPVCIQ